MSVRDLLGRKGTAVFTGRPTMTVDQAVRLLLKHNIGGLPVVTPGGSLVGFVSERDIVRAIATNSEKVRAQAIEQVMRRPAPTCRSDESLHEVMSRMTRKRLRHLVAVDDDRIVGVISIGDLVKHRLEQLETETGVLRDYLAGRRALG